MLAFGMSCFNIGIYSILEFRNIEDIEAHRWIISIAVTIMFLGLSMTIDRNEPH